MSVRDRTGDGRKPKWTPSVLELCVLALIIAAAGWGLQALGNMIESHLTGRREDTIANLFQTLDYDISYRDISPSLLRAFEVRDLAISNRGASDDPLVFIRHLRLRYSLSRLVISRDPVAALREIQLVDSDFTLDLEGDRGLGILLQALSVAVSGGDDSLGPTELPPMNLAGANLGVVIEGRGTRVELRELYFRVRAGERLRITASGNVAALLSSTVSPALLGNEFLGNRLPDHRQRRGRLQFGRRHRSRTGVDCLFVRRRPADAAGDVRCRQPAGSQGQGSPSARGAVHVRPEQRTHRTAVRGRGPATGGCGAVRRRRSGAGGAAGGGSHRKRALDSGPGGRNELRRRPQRADPAGAGRPATEVVVAATGDGERLVVSRLDARMEQIGVQFVGDVLLDPIAPQGDLIVATAPDLLGGVPLNARLTLRRNGSGIDLRGDSMTLGDTAVRGFEANLSPAGSGQPRFRYRARMALEQDAADSISSEECSTFGLALTWASRLASPTLPPAPCTASPRPGSAPAVAGHYAGAAARKRHGVRQHRLRRRATWPLDGARARPRRTRDRLRFRLGREGEDWLLDDLAAQWDGFRMQGDATVTPVEESLELAANFTVNDEPLFLRVTHRAGEGLTASGSHQLSLDADYPAAGGISFRGSVIELPMPWSAEHPPLKATMAFSGAVGESAEWSLRSDAVTVAGIPFLDRRGAELEFGFRASANGVSFDPVSLRDGESELTGSGSVTYGGGQEALAGRLALADAAGYERISIAASLDRGNLDGSAEIHGVPLARVGEFPVSGDLRATVTASGPMQGLVWSAAVHLENGGSTRRKSRWRQPSTRNRQPAGRPDHLRSAQPSPAQREVHLRP